MDSAAEAPSVSAPPHCAASLKVLFRGHGEVEEAGFNGRDPAIHVFI